MNTFAIVLVVLSIFVGLAIAVLGTFFSKKKLVNNEAYFTAGRNIGVGFMTASFIAYAVGTGLIFSPGEMAWLQGTTAMLGYALAISVAYLVFIPISGKIKELIPQGHTIGEYTKIRYGAFMYIVSLVVSTIYMFILFVANMIGSAIMFKYVANVPMLLSVVIVGIPTIYFAAAGGVSAAIFTSGIQSILVTPLLFIPALACVIKVGGVGEIYAKLAAVDENFLRIFNKDGMQFAIMIIIAVTAAELLNQTLWQRIYTAKNHKIIKKSLISAALMVFPMTVIASSLGLFSKALNLDVPNSSIASGMVIAHVLPPWAVMLFCLVVVVAASSTGGDALSGLASIISIDIVRPLNKNIENRSLVSIGRLGACIMGIAGLVVAYFEPSILMTLLLADLLASAAVVPVILGLYSKRITGTGAALATLAGIAVGMPFYLKGQSLPSFGLALLTATVVVVISMLFSKNGFDFNRLKEEIREIGGAS